jgi:hypothetical protein
MSKQVDHTGDRVVFDIEVSPAEYWLWKGGYGINVPTANLLKEPAVICISYQWEGEKKIHHLQWDKNQNDKAMLEKFIPIMQQAGTIIGHNSDNFDIKWLRTRCLFHRLPMPPEFITIDTWKQAKKFFRFQGNGLKYIARFLGLEGKIETGENAKLWQEVVYKKSAKAMKQMLRYCDRDVDQTMKVYEAFLPYTLTVGHVGNNMTDCPHCGGKNTKWEKDRTTQKGGSHTQFRCHTPKKNGKGICGKYATVASTKWYNETPIKKHRGKSK